MVPDLYDEYCDKVWKQITDFHALYFPSFIKGGPDFGCCIAQSFSVVTPRHQFHKPLEININGEHSRHLQTCCQNFFHGAPRPTCDNVTVNTSALVPRRDDVIPICDLDT